MISNLDTPTDTQLNKWSTWEHLTERLAVIVPNGTMHYVADGTFIEMTVTCSKGHRHQAQRFEGWSACGMRILLTPGEPHYQAIAQCPTCAAYAERLN